MIEITKGKRFVRLDQIQWVGLREANVGHPHHDPLAYSVHLIDGTMVHGGMTPRQVVDQISQIQGKPPAAPKPT